MPIPNIISTLQVTLAYGIGMLTSSGINAWSAQKNSNSRSVIAQLNRWSSQDIAQLDRAHQAELQYRQLKFSVLQQREDQDFQRELAQLNHERKMEIEQFRVQVSRMINQENIDFQKWRFGQEKQIQAENLQLQQEFQERLAHFNHECSLNYLREKMRADTSPIHNLTCDLLENAFSHGVMSLQVLFSPPLLDYEPESEKAYQASYESILAQEIRQFLHEGYHNNKYHRVKLLDKAWISNEKGGGSAAYSLHGQLKSIPVLIIDSKTLHNLLNMNCSYWGGNNEELVEFPFLDKVSCQELLYISARSRAKKWERDRQKLEDEGDDENYIKQIGGIDEHNLQVWKQELVDIEKLTARGIDTRRSRVKEQYKITQEDYYAFYDFLAVMHCLMIGFFADTLFLGNSWENIPLLPKSLNYLLAKYQNNCHLTSEFWDKTIPEIVMTYGEYYSSLEKNNGCCLPEIKLQFAQSLTQLPTQYHYLALTQASKALQDWLKAHNVAEDTIFDIDSDHDCVLLKQILYQEDESFFQSLQDLFNQIDGAEKLERKSIAQIQGILQEWKNLKCRGNIANLSNITIESSELQIQTNPANIIEKLNDDVSLEMVYIPAGEFMMGSHEYDNEKPIHKVKLDSFYMGKFPVTQAQYQAIMDDNPSYFKGDSRPVECLTWNMAQEFCRELSAKTGKNYQLPSEAQWEYACRAGTSTRYYFGDDVSQLSDYAWYDHNSGGKTHPVGQKKPNAWGLYDMHGNVWEWCQDDYVGNYKNTPRDGTFYREEYTKFLVFRGGGYYDNVLSCRSANRYWFTCDNSYDNFGVRIMLFV